MKSGQLQTPTIPAVVRNRAAVVAAWPAMLALGLAFCAMVSVVGRWFEFTGMVLTKTQWVAAVLVGSALLSIPLHTLRVRPTWRMMSVAFLIQALSLLALVPSNSNLWVLNQTLFRWADFILLVTGTMTIATVIALIVKGIEYVGGDEVPTDTRPLTLRNLAVVSGVVIVMGLYLSAYTARQDWVPFWDYGHYWRESLSLLNSPSPLSALRTSIWHHEYNLIPAVLPSLFMSTLGTSWTTYVFIIFAVYGVANGLATLWCLKPFQAPHERWPAAVWPGVLLLSCPILWGAAFRGYLDFGGVAIAMLIFGLFLHQPLKGLTLRRSIQIGMLFVLLFLFRRWYSIWVVSFVMIASAEWLITVLRSGSRWKATRPMLVMGITAVAVLLLFAWPNVVRILSTSYRDAYTAYKLPGNGWERFVALGETIGWATPLFFGVAACAGVCVPSLRRVTCYAVGTAVLSFLIFQRIQDMGPHHHLLFAPSLLLLFGSVGHWLISRSSWWLPALAVPGIFGMLLSFEPALSPVRERLTPFAPVHPIEPVVRHDWEPLRTLIERVNQTANDRHGSFAVLASSTTINQYLVRNFHESRGLPLPSPWSQALFHEVDKTGDFPEVLLTANVFLVPTTAQIHLPAPEQRIVTLAAESVRTGRGLGAGCVRLGESVTIDHGVTLEIYVRQRELTDKEKDDFASQIKAMYPDWPRVWRSKKRGQVRF